MNNILARCFVKKKKKKKEKEKKRKKKRNQETASSGNGGNVSLFFTQFNESCSRHEYAKRKENQIIYLLETAIENRTKCGIDMEIIDGTVVVKSTNERIRSVNLSNRIKSNLNKQLSQRFPLRNIFSFITERRKSLTKNSKLLISMQYYILYTIILLYNGDSSSKPFSNIFLFEQ